MKYITKYKKQVPLILENKELVEVDINNASYQHLSCADNQFVYSLLVDANNMFRHGYNGRLRQFVFGKGLLSIYKKLIAVLCKNNKVIVDVNWEINYPAEFNRFKKMLRENGYNTRKCITSLSSGEIENFYIDILSPSLEDYTEDRQKELSKMFIETQKVEVLV